MPLVAYTVTASLPDAATRDRYLAWLHPAHTAAVVAAGAQSASVVKLSEPPLQVQVRYQFADEHTLETYLRDHAPALRADGLKAFPPHSGVTFRREVGVLLPPIFPDVRGVSPG